MAEFLCCSPETIITLLICYVLCLVAQLCLTLCNTMIYSPPGSSVHGNSPGKNTGVGCHALLQGSFLAQGSNWILLYCRWILYQLRYQGSPTRLYPNTKLKVKEKKKRRAGWGLHLGNFGEPNLTRAEGHYFELFWAIFLTLYKLFGQSN